jgi:hypothetical protein
MATFQERIFSVNVYHDGRRLSQQIGGLYLREAIREMAKRRETQREAVGGLINGRRRTYSLADLEALADAISE